MTKAVFEIYKLHEGCFVRGGKLVAVGGFNAVTSRGKRYIKPSSEEQKTFIKSRFVFCLRTGRTFQLTAEDSGDMLTKIFGVRSIGKRKNAERLRAKAELRRTIDEDFGNKVCTGYHRSGDILASKMSQMLGGIGVALGIADAKKGVPPITRRAFEKFPIGVLTLNEYIELPRHKRIKKMKELMKKHPDVIV